MTQFIFCNSYCLPGVVEEENDMELQQTLRVKECNEKKKLIKKSNTKKKFKQKTPLTIVHSRASVKLIKSSALQHYKILNDNSVYSSDGGETELTNINKKRNKVSNDLRSNMKPLDKSNDRCTEQVSSTPTANSINNPNKLTLEKSNKNDKSNDKSNNSKLNDKVNTNLKDNIIIKKQKAKSKNPNFIKDNIYELNQAYSKLSRKKVLSSYDENAVYGMPSINAMREYRNKKLNSNETESLEKTNESVNEFNPQETDSEENEEEYDENYIKRTPQNKNVEISLKTQGKIVPSVKYSKIVHNQQKSPNSYSKEQDTFHTDKYRNYSENKNLEFLSNKNNNPFYDDNNRYASNPPNYNLSHLYSTGIVNSNNQVTSSNRYNNQYNQYPQHNQYGYQQHSAISQRQNNISSFNSSNNYIYPKNAIGTGGDQNSSNFNRPLMKDTFSCSYCEEFYKMALFQNVPLQLLSCPYCQNTINQTSLQFYYKKFECELNQTIKESISSEYKKELSKPSINKNSPVLKNSNQLNGTLECQNMSTYPTRNNISLIEENRKDDYINREVKKPKEYVTEAYIEEEDDYKDSKRSELKEKTIRSKKSINIKKPKSKEEFTSHNEEEEKVVESKLKDKKEVIMIKIDDERDNDTENLAEMFKKKKMNFIEKMEKRKQEFQNKPEKEEKVEEIKPKLRKTKVLKKKESNKDLAVSIKSAVIKEPPQELLHRLSQGEKVNMTKKEMNELNLRLISTLPEVRKQENDEKKKQDTHKRLENSKSFAQKLKEDVVKNKKVDV